MTGKGLGQRCQWIPSLLFARLDEYAVLDRDNTQRQSNPEGKNIPRVTYLKDACLADGDLAPTVFQDPVIRAHEVLYPVHVPPVCEGEREPRLGRVGQDRRSIAAARPPTSVMHYCEGANPTREQEEETVGHVLVENGYPLRYWHVSDR
jgi:hypothetical protein